MRRLLLLLITGLCAWLIWTLCRGPAATPQASPPATEAATTAPAGQAAAGEPRQPAPGQIGRQVQRAPSGFVSYDEDGKTLDPLPRDGLVLLLRDAEGAPVPEQQITAFWRRGFGLYGRDEGRTDTRGRFATTIPALHMLESVEVPRTKGRVLSAHRRFEQNAAGLVVVQIPSLITIQLQVLDLEGRPFAGVRGRYEALRYLDPPQVTLLRDVQEQFETDAEGRLSLVLPRGGYHLRCMPGGPFQPLHQLRIHPTAGLDEYPMVIYGHRTGSGKPLEIQVRHPPDLAKPPGVQLQVTDLGEIAPAPAWLKRRLLDRSIPAQLIDSGRYRLTDRPPTGARIRAAHPECRPAATMVSAHSETARLVLSRRPRQAPKQDNRVRLQGQLMAADGKQALAFAKVRLLRNTRILWGDSADTDREGQFLIHSKPGGRVILMGIHGGQHAFFGPYELDEDQLNLRLQMPEFGAGIEGRVVDRQGRGVHAQLNIYARRGRLAQLDGSDPRAFLVHCPQEQMRSSDKETGRFRFASLPAGETFCIIAQPWEGSQPQGRVVVRAGSQGVRLVLGEGFVDDVRIEGQIREARTGTGIAGVTIRGTRTDPGGRSLGEVLSGGDGSFRMVGGTPGKFSFFVHHRGFAAIEVEDKQLRVGKHALAFKLWPTTTAYLRLLDRRGQPLRGVEVSAYDPSNQALLILQDSRQRPDFGLPSTDFQGRVDLVGLPQTRVRLVFRGPKPKTTGAKTASSSRVLDLSRPRAEVREIRLGF